MLKEERFQFIKNKLTAEQRVLLAELCAEMDVSDDTVRRDLIEMEKAGLLIKVHGGAILPTPTSPTAALTEPKQKVIGPAWKVLDLFTDGNTLLLNAGPAMVELARELPDTVRLTVFTNSFPVVAALADKPLIQVVMFGGNVLQRAQSTAGAEVFRQLQSFTFDWLVSECSHIDLDQGITVANREEGRLLREMVLRSRQRLFLVTSDAWGSSERHPVCLLADVQVLSVPEPMVESVKDQLKNLSLEVR